jgi:zinc protease
MSNGIIKTILANGLTINLKEMRNAPITSHWVWYRVGSRNEVPGLTGLSHWVEHMQFKGTPRYPAGLMDKAISRDGGYWNAFTYLDWTAYFETLPAEKTDLALRLEADRMTNSRFNPKDVESERTVIISEREGSENEPLFRLGEAMQSAGFDHHPYRNEVIGYKDDLRAITREDLYRHYRTFYNPANAVVALAGDFDASKMLVRLEELYGGIPSVPLPELKIEEEDQLGGERRVELAGPGETTYIQVSYRAPAANTPDFFALTVLDSLLSGPAGLNMFGGGGISNKTSRLYRALVEKELAVHVSGGLQATIDPFFYETNLTVHPNRTPAEILSAFDDEIKRLQEALISEDEVHRAIKQARALFAYSSENVTNQAFWMGFSEMFATYDWFSGYLDAMARVTPEDVQRIANSWLRSSSRVVGIYLPTGSAEPSQEKPT